MVPSSTGFSSRRSTGLAGAWDQIYFDTDSTAINSRSPMIVKNVAYHPGAPHLNWPVPGRPPDQAANHVAAMARTVTAITIVPTQPRICSGSGRVKPAMIRRRIERCIMAIITGTATTPFRIALQ